MGNGHERVVWDERLQCYRPEQPAGQVKIRDRHGELVGWTAFGQTRAKDGSLVSFQENEGLFYMDLK